MRLRIALDVTEIRDPEVRQAVDDFLALEDNVLKLSDESTENTTRFERILQLNKEAHEQLSAAKKKLAAQYSEISNAVLGYQAASLRATNTSKYKASFVKTLSSVTANIKRAAESLGFGEKEPSERTARIARALFLANGPESKDETDALSVLENQVNQLSSKAKTATQFVTKNDELIAGLNDIMKALGVGDVSSSPQAPQGPVAPTPVPESPSAFQQPAAPQEKPEKVEEPR